MKQHVVLVVEKSCLRSLHLCIEGLLENIDMPSIYLIVPDVQIHDFNSFISDSVTVVKESVIQRGYSNSSIKELLGEKSYRSGWYLQQFLKLDFGYFISSDEYLIWDADTVLLRPLNKTSDSELFIHHLGRQSQHLPYNETFTKLFGQEFPLKKSVISQYMWCRQSDIVRFQAEICNRLGVANWVDGVLQNLNCVSDSEFSEYEFFVNFFELIREPRYELVSGKWFLHGADILTPNRDLPYNYIKSRFVNYDFVAFERHNLSDKPTRRFIRSLYANYCLFLGLKP